MLPTIGLAFTNHPNIFDVCAELDRPTEQRKSLVVNLTTAGVHRASATIAAARVGVCARAPVPFAAAVRTSASAWRVPAVCMAVAPKLRGCTCTVCVVLYASMGILGYWRFGSATQVNILLNFSNRPSLVDLWLFASGRLGMVLALSFAAPSVCLHSLLVCYRIPCVHLSPRLGDRRIHAERSAKRMETRALQPGAVSVPRVPAQRAQILALPLFSSSAGQRFAEPWGELQRSRTPQGPIVAQLSPSLFNYGEALFLICMAYVLSAFVPELETVFGLTGAISGSLLVYVLPAGVPRPTACPIWCAMACAQPLEAACIGRAAFYLRLHPRSGRAPGCWGTIFWWCACGLIVIGTCIGIVSTVFIVY